MSSYCLDLCDGPPCSRCGCRDTAILADPTPGAWWPTGKARCHHCGKVFYFREVPSPPEPPRPAQAAPLPREVVGDVLEISVPVVDQQVIPKLTCEACGTQMKVTSTRKTVRFYKCPSCGAREKLARTA